MKQFTMIFTVAFLVSGTAMAAKGGFTDISTGIAFPSDNDAAFFGGSRIHMSQNAFDVSSEPLNDSYDVVGSVVGASKGIGFGAGLMYYDIPAPIGAQKIIFGGLGYGSDKFGLGVNSTYNLDATADELDLNAGASFGGAEGLVLALTFRSIILGDYSLLGGVGYKEKMYTLEVDVEYELENDGDTTNDIEITPAVSFMLMQGKLSIGGGYRFYSEDIGNGTWIGKAHFWLADKVGLYYAYQNPVYPSQEHSFGLKVAF